MSYKVGISSGWWQIGKDPNLLGLALKAGQFGATQGVQFNQVDLDTILEFLEPDLKKFVIRYKRDLGIEIGLHGEVHPSPIMLESAERREWDQSHDRHAVTMRGCAELGIVYLNIHTSNKIQLIQEERQLRPFGYTYQVVDHKGRPFWRLAEESPAVKAYILKIFEKGAGGVERELSSEEGYKKKIGDFNANFEKKAFEEAERRVRAGEAKTAVQTEFDRVYREWINDGTYYREKAKVLYDIWRHSTFAKYLLETGEIDAYITVATYMIEQSDPLWTNVVGSTQGDSPHEKAEDAYVNQHELFNAAVAMKYIEGHLTTINEDNRKVLGGKSMLDYCKEKNIYILLETPHSSAGTEGLWRLYNPLHYQHIIRKLACPILKMTIDFEQTMAQRIDIDEDLIKKMPPDFGKMVHTLHVGEPVPYFGSAHIPIAIGGHGMHVLYRWIYALKKTGFKDGIFIFERGSGRRGGQGTQPGEVFEESVRALRQIIKYLDKDILPDDLPPEFFGISMENPDVFARQRVIMREHAWDPLEGLLMQPEEKHGFFSRAAVEKGKGEVWEKRKYR